MTIWYRAPEKPTRVPVWYTWSKHGNLLVSWGDPTVWGEANEFTTQRQLDTLPIVSAVGVKVPIEIEVDAGL